MPRRVSLPSSDDLFRSTDEEANAARPRRVRRVSAVPDPEPEQGATETAAEASARRSSGRVRHDEKMTVYVTAEELLDLEDARLAMRRDHGLAVDRGRLVREAIAIVLADLKLNGERSVLVERLGEA